MRTIINSSGEFTINELGQLIKFVSNDNISDLIVPAGVTRIGVCEYDITNIFKEIEYNGYENAIFSNKSWHRVVFPEELLMIGIGEFRDCAISSEIVFPSSLEIICEKAFMNSSLPDVRLPESLKYIGVCGFACANFKSLYLPISSISMPCGRQFKDGSVKERLVLPEDSNDRSDFLRNFYSYFLGNSFTSHRWLKRVEYIFDSDDDSEIKKLYNKKIFLPVIHVEDKVQALRNTQIAIECGADGVFIISHGTMDHKELFDLAKYLKEHFKGLWVGVNCLDLSAKDAAGCIPDYIDGLWSDNAHVDEREECQPYAEDVKNLLQEWNGLYFGGVAFKYQHEVKDLEVAVKISKSYMDVICTSGKGTGYAADVNKLKRMKSAADDFPIAIASGITPDNIDDYLPYVDYYLVATGIGRSFTELDEDKVRSLADKIHNYKA